MTSYRVHRTNPNKTIHLSFFDNRDEAIIFARNYCKRRTIRYDNIYVDEKNSDGIYVNIYSCNQTVSGINEIDIS